MFFELIAAIAAAFVGAGLALAAIKATGGRLPRWLTPLAAGAAMLGYAIWSEYTWYARTAASLPAGFAVVETNEARAAFRPWTYVLPYIDRFAAIDTASVGPLREIAGHRLADMVFYGRWAPVQPMKVVVDCDGGRLAPAPSVRFAEDGTIADATWQPLAEDAPALAAACGPD